MSSAYTDFAGHYVEWQKRAAHRCADRIEAAERLEAALDMMGASKTDEPEPGMSARQVAIEGCVRSVSLFLRSSTELS